MRPPAASLVVDASVLIAAVSGRSSSAIADAARRRSLLTTARALEEARRRLALGFKRPDLLIVLDQIVATMTVSSMGDVERALPAAAEALRDAVPSRNGSTDDAHVLALAWLADADIWSPDRAFAGTGVASWSTPNLMRALAPEGDAT